MGVWQKLTDVLGRLHGESQMSEAELSAWYKSRGGPELTAYDAKKDLLGAPKLRLPDEARSGSPQVETTFDPVTEYAMGPLAGLLKAKAAKTIAPQLAESGLQKQVSSWFNLQNPQDVLSMVRPARFNLRGVLEGSDLLRKTEQAVVAAGKKDLSAFSKLKSQLDESILAAHPAGYPNIARTAARAVTYRDEAGALGEALKTVKMHGDLSATSLAARQTALKETLQKSGVGIHMIDKLSDLHPIFRAPYSAVTNDSGIRLLKYKESVGGGYASGSYFPNFRAVVAPKQPALGTLYENTLIGHEGAHDLNRTLKQVPTLFESHGYNSSVWDEHKLFDWRSAAPKNTPPLPSTAYDYAGMHHHGTNLTHEERAFRQGFRAVSSKARKEYKNLYDNAFVESGRTSAALENIGRISSQLNDTEVPVVKALKTVFGAESDVTPDAIGGTAGYRVRLPEPEAQAAPKPPPVTPNIQLEIQRALNRRVTPTINTGTNMTPGGRRG